MRSILKSNKKGFEKVILNVILAFVIPWSVCTFPLFKRGTRLVIIVDSFLSVVAFTVNEIGVSPTFRKFCTLRKFEKGFC